MPAADRERGRPLLLRSDGWPYLLVPFILNQVTQDGEPTWFEGVQLLAVYAIIGVAFFIA